MTRSEMTGAGHLVRLTLRRDRVRLPLWVLGLTGLTAVSAGAVQDLYATPDQVASYASTVGSSAVQHLVNGTPVALDTLGGITSYEVTATAGVVVALMVTFLVVRHTRAEEESGRAELLRGLPLGRHAATAATAAVAVAASLAVGVLDAVVLLANGLPARGSVLHGAALAAVGVLFTAVAALLAQVTSSARVALGMAGAVIGLAFLVRGLGAIGDTVLVWLSPFGWQQEVGAYGVDRWWPVGLLLGTAAIVGAGAAALTVRRDAGAGLRHPRPGPARASRRLGTALGFAVRMQRGTVLAWASGVACTAALFGAVGREVVALVEENPTIGDLLGTAGADSVLDAFFAFVISLLAVVATALPVSLALRLRTEEHDQRAEVLLATALSRSRWVGGWLAVATGGTVLCLALNGIVAGLTHALVSGESDRVPQLLGASLAQAPAVLLVAAIAVVLLGWAPRWARLAWALVGLAVAQAYLGELLRLPDAIAGLSPFWHLPAVPADAFRPGPAAALVVLAAATAGLGLLGWRRRDIG
ncbi:MAG: ABC transporter permease [Dermatophilaceae bacterium]